MSGSDTYRQAPKDEGSAFGDSVQPYLSLLSFFPFLFPAVVLLVGIGFILVSVWFRVREPAAITFSTEASASATGDIHVDVAGSVQTPNVYRLAPGSRIQDALIAAGGLSARADREWVEKFINRAAPVADGAKLYIPKQGEHKNIIAQNEKSKPGEVAAAPTQLINVNTATAAELDTLPGIGEKTAEKIIAGRPYETIEALVEKKIVGQSVFANIRNLIRVY